MTDKRKKRLSIAERVKIIERLNAGQSGADLAAQYEVSKQAISKIKKNAENILKAERILGASTKKKRVGSENTALDQSMYNWFTQKRSLGHPVSGATLREKALFFNKMLDGSKNFKGSIGWLDRFRKRHDIRQLSNQGERLSADLKASESFGNEFSEFVMSNGIQRDRVYNADETGLLWKILPNRTLEKHCEREAPGQITAKDRVTIMVCSNASGTHKIPLLVIGKSQRSRCFKNIKTLPVVYKEQKNSWMDRVLFTEWYKEVFLPAIIERHGADSGTCILLLDNAPSHPSAAQLNLISRVCQVMYLPPSVSSLIQPMNQGIIEKIKRIYKREFLQQLLIETETASVVHVFKSWTMLNCCNLIAWAWKSVTQQNIKNSWKTLLRDDIIPPLEPILDTDMFMGMLRQIPNGSETTIEEVNEWLQDNNDPGWQILSDEEHVFGIKENQDTEEEDCEEEEVKVTAEKALEGLGNLELWYQTCLECTQEQITLFQDIRVLAIAEILSKRKRKPLIDDSKKISRFRKNDLSD